MVQIAFVAPDDWTIWSFYRHLIAALQRRSARVTAFSAAGSVVSRLNEQGIDHVTVPYARFIDPATDLRLFRALKKEFTHRRFAIVQNVTIKANLFGPLAAHSAGVTRIINTVEGAGLLYSDEPTARIRLIRAAAEIGLKRARRYVSRYWFVNERDRDVFVRRGLIAREKSVVSLATGVDTSLFSADRVSGEEIRKLRDSIGLRENIPVVVNVAGRLLRSKGIADFIDAARIQSQRGVSAQWLLVGPEEPGNPDAMDPAVVRSAVEQGIIKWIPFREDVWTVYAASDIAVVPSYYPEGTPKGVQEAMAMSRPLVCADIPSTRALVNPGEDAMLFSPRDSHALATIVEKLLLSPDSRNAMSRRARSTAVARFDADTAANIAVEKVYGSWLS